MKKKRVIVSVIVGTGLMIYHYYSLSGADLEGRSGIENQVKERELVTLSPSPTSLKAPEQTRSMASEKSDLTNLKNREIAQRFEALLSKYDDLKKYFDHLGYLGRGPEAVLARVWISLGLFVYPDQEEAILLNLMVKELAGNSDPVMTLLEKKQVEISQDEAFTEQMTLPLVHLLSITAERKVSFYGNVIDRPMEFSQGGVVTPKAANITNALIYMQQANVPYSVVEPYLLRAVQTSNLNEQSRQELMMRVSAYFPDFKEH